MPPLDSFLPGRADAADAEREGGAPFISGGNWSEAPRRSGTRRVTDGPDGLSSMAIDDGTTTNEAVTGLLPTVASNGDTLNSP